MVPFPVAIDIGGDKDSSAAVAMAVAMPVDPDSDKEHPPHEPQFVFHAVDDEREERLRFFMILPQAVLCWSTFIFGGMMIYLANNPNRERAQPGFNWDAFVTASSALLMLFSLLSLLLSHLGVYYYDGWPGLNQWLR